MIDFLAGVPGKLKAVYDHLTTYIDATISSRAPASTALSSATWTGTKAGYLDVSVASRASESTPLLDTPVAGGFSTTYVSISGATSIPPIGGIDHFSTTSTTDVDVINYSGQGVLEFCAAWNAGNASTYLTLIIDGVTNSLQSGTYFKPICPAGAIWATETAVSIALSAIPFKSSLVVKVRSTGTAVCRYKYRKTA